MDMRSPASSSEHIPPQRLRLRLVLARFGDQKQPAGLGQRDAHAALAQRCQLRASQIHRLAKRVEESIPALIDLSLDERTFLSDSPHMTGNEFVRKVRALGKRQGVPVMLDAIRRKGSHQTLSYGDAFTVVRNPKDELKTGTFHAMCVQLGISARDL